MDYNKARQQAITNEMLDITGGAEAMAAMVKTVVTSVKRKILGGSMEYQTGRVVQIQSSVVDVEFSIDNMPDIYEALEVVSQEGPSIVLEVEKHLGDNVVRCVAMDTTDGMQRNTTVRRTGAPIKVPVGPNILGRVFNVLGEPVDNKGPVEAEAVLPHPPAGTNI